jgi:hypothetical protein
VTEVLVVAVPLEVVEVVDLICDRPYQPPNSVRVAVCAVPWSCANMP